MFTGLVETLGLIKSAERRTTGMRLTLKPLSAFGFREGDSIAINGVCLTVTEEGKELKFDVSPETMKSTNLGTLKANEKVNIERALMLSDRLGGHMVTGHVDAVGVIQQRDTAGEYTLYKIGAPPDILKYIVKKGSVAVDGISLTVTELDSQSFSISIIPHTLTATNIGEKKKGDSVNIEVDMIGKYVERLLSPNRKDKDLSSLLLEKGFKDRA